MLVWRGVVPAHVVGTTSACGIGSALGYALHAPAGALPAHAVGYVYLPAAIGGVAVTSVLWHGLAYAISGAALKRVFAAFLAIMGTSLLFGG